MFFYKESTLFFDCFYWLHQCLNTTSYVGILLLPCGAPEDKGDGLCGAPLLYPLDSNSSPRGIRCGGAYRLPRAWGNIGSLYPVQVDNPQFRILFGCLCSGWYRSRFSRVVGWVSFVFHYWGDRSFISAATWGFCHNLSLDLHAMYCVG